MNPYDTLKDKLAYFGGYKWLPYIDAVELLNELTTYKLALNEIQKIYEYGQPDHDGEVMVEIEDTCDAMYEIAKNALEK